MEKGDSHSCIVSDPELVIELGRRELAAVVTIIVIVVGTERSGGNS